MLKRQPAVAGMFYPDNPQILQQQVDGFLNAASTEELTPKALIVPHAGYIYSGAIAASAYRLLKPLAQRLTRVVLLGPAHRVPVRGLAAPAAHYFSTPLGDIPIDQTGIDHLKKRSLIGISDQAHELEHSLEVQLPFLQQTLDDFNLLPLVVGDADHNLVAEVLRCSWGGDETLVVISSDLSHYHPYTEAQCLDHQTTAMIEQYNHRIKGDQACGCRAINGLLTVANAEHMMVKTLDLRNSGDTAGDREQVVGYGAYAFY